MIGQLVSKQGKNQPSNNSDEESIVNIFFCKREKLIHVKSVEAIKMIIISSTAGTLMGDKYLKDKRYVAIDTSKLKAGVYIIEVFYNTLNKSNHDQRTRFKHLEYISF